MRKARAHSLQPHVSSERQLGQLARTGKEGARADAAVAAGAQPQGCYWYLDTRLDEMDSISQRGWTGRLRRAARALDERLKADPNQSCVHGDCKSANMLWDGEQLAMCDFQYFGKACPMKDMAYLLCCAAADGAAHEAAHLQAYLRVLNPILAARGEAPPSLDSLVSALDVAYADLCRWMCGWGMWGDSFLVPRVQATLERLDGGVDLGSEEAYREAVATVFPVLL